jgi:hypothetical protein
MTKQPRKGPFCGGKLRTRPGTCKQPPGFHTDHAGTGRCFWHGGCGPSGVKAGQHAMAVDAAARLSLPIMTTAEQALQDALNRANGHAIYLTGQVEALPGDARIWGTLKRTTSTGTGEGEGPETTTVEQAGPSVWETLLLQWDKQLASVATEMLRAGIAERRTQLDEELGAKIGAALDAALAGLPAVDQARRKALLAGRLRAIAG